MKKLFYVLICVLFLIVVGQLTSCKPKKGQTPIEAMVDTFVVDSIDVEEVYEDSVVEEVEEPAPVPTNTFQSADDVMHRLCGHTYVHKGGMEIRVSGGGRMSFDHQDAGRVSVLQYSAKNALIRFRGGMFGEGRYRVRFADSSLQLIDDEEGFVFNQR